MRSEREGRHVEDGDDGMTGDSTRCAYAIMPTGSICIGMA